MCLCVVCVFVCAIEIDREWRRRERSETFSESRLFAGPTKEVEVKVKAAGTVLQFFEDGKCLGTIDSPGPRAFSLQAAGRTGARRTESVRESQSWRRSEEREREREKREREKREREREGSFPFVSCAG